MMGWTDWNDRLLSVRWGHFHTFHHISDLGSDGYSSPSAHIIKGGSDKVITRRVQTSFESDDEYDTFSD